jgi:hypothetical protein
MTVIEFIVSRPDIVTVWGLIVSVGGAFFTLIAKGLIHIHIVVRRPKDGHRERIAMVEIGHQSSEEIPSGEYKAIQEKEDK